MNYSTTIEGEYYGKMIDMENPPLSFIVEKILSDFNPQYNADQALHFALTAAYVSRNETGTIVVKLLPADGGTHSVKQFVKDLTAFFKMNLNTDELPVEIQ